MSETVGEWFDNPHPVDDWVPVGPVVSIPIPPEGQAVTAIPPEAYTAATNRLAELVGERDVPTELWGWLDEALTAALPHIEAAIRASISDEIAAWLDSESSPPIWYQAVDIADPTYCERHPEEEATNE